MDEFELDNYVLHAIKEEELKKFKEQEKFFQTYDDKKKE